MSQAQTVKVGLALDMSGPFAVAMKQLGGKLGGVLVEYVEVDTGGNSETTRQAVKRMLAPDKIDLLSGPSALRSHAL